MRKILYFPALLVLLNGCASSPRGAYSPANTPYPPEYSQEEYWAALPWKEDAADLTPDGLEDRQQEAPADVFFLHPTTYTGKRGDTLWNGPVAESDVNQRTLETPIKFQATIFNGAGRVFAPFFRQAHLEAYYTKDTVSARQAFDLAYSDVREAFRYYLDNFNQGRPIIIASHSQGTTHGTRLVKEFFDDKPLREKLVAAYLVGIPVREDAFSTIPPCQDSLDTGCFTSWRTFKRGTTPRTNTSEVLVTNPLLWTTNEAYAPKGLNKGAVLRPFRKVRPKNADAQIHGPILWASKPKFFGSFLLWAKNYHAGDFNIYYLNVRENAQARVSAFLSGKGDSP